jgi:hypothetical protein
MYDAAHLTATSWLEADDIGNGWILIQSRARW